MASLQDMKIIALPAIWGVLICNSFVMGILWLYLRRKNRLQEIGWHQWSIHGLWFTLGVAFLCIAAAMGFNFVYTQFLFPDIEMQAGMKEMLDAIPKTLPNQILIFVTVAIAAPVVEEVVFRGMLQRSMTQYMPPWAAIILSAFIFAIIHMQPEAIGALMALGIAFGVIYHVTKSLKATILLHLVNNAAALILQPLAEKAAEAEAAPAFILPLLLL